ncbi:MraY family glycosyltransferase [Mucilaginibacter sp. KACC 22063]|uniref:MraY family glycosyltransferase n=1 Tax=Mucilaginibacter sp. KACC 22063 TaxID=3025666 RepID=UPI002366BCD2|nr:glycosyltransferase family 4 protein [Mucilaginibacter sp. KACC 22063]WDF54010.1 glycosyltransferase family 4 protein [Mucilaginibacter sp. KACC 22063]
MRAYSLIICLVVLAILELIYFKIADHFNIIDKPNHRSSHSSITIRGGGIIFALSLLLLYPCFHGLQHVYFLVGLFLISAISFIDDINPVSNRLRIIVHLIAVAAMFYQLDLYHLPVYLIMAALIFVIGTINAINFMDGINGITGIYGLVALSTLYYINTKVGFIEPQIIALSILSVLVFGYFNFRKKAKCFAGDVGSVSLAFIILFLILKLIVATQDLKYILILLVYGLDTFTTIVFRLIRKENIFEAHRSHFYQYWANEKKKPHILVAALYGLSQLIINIALIYLNVQSIFTLVLILIGCILAFILIRLLTEGYKHLLGNVNLT